MRQLIVVVSVVCCVTLLASVAPASAAGGRGSVRVQVTGLPAGQNADIALKRSGERRRQLRRGQSKVGGLRPGRWTLVVRAVKLREGARGVRARATVLPVRARVAVTVRAKKTVTVKAAYGSVVNPGVRGVPSRIVRVLGPAERPTGLVLRTQDAPPVGGYLTSGPSEQLPVGLVARVTRSRRAPGGRELTLRDVAVTEVAPVITYDGPVALSPPGTTLRRQQFGGQVDYNVVPLCGVTSSFVLSPSFNLGSPSLEVDIRPPLWNGGPKADLRHQEPSDGRRALEHR